MRIDGPQVDDKGGPEVPLFNPRVGGRTPSAQLPAQYTQNQTALNNQLTAAREYRKNLPQLSNKLYEQYAGQSKRDLASAMKDVDKDYNRRGLLHSGMRTSAQFGAQADSANDRAQARNQINQGLLANADTLEGNAFGTAGGIAGLNYNYGDQLIQGQQSDINFQQSRDQSNQRLWNTVLGGAGGIAGGIAGRRGSGGSSGGGGTGAATGAAAGGAIGMGW